MAQFTDVHDWCWKCRGTGLEPIGGGQTADCTACEGDGKVFTGYVDTTDITNKLDDVTTKLDNLEEKIDEVKDAVEALG